MSSIPKPSEKVINDLRQISTATLTGTLGKLLGSCDPFFMEHLKPMSGEFEPGKNMVDRAVRFNMKK